MPPYGRGKKRQRAPRGKVVHPSDVAWTSMPVGSHAEDVNVTTDEAFGPLDLSGDDFLGLQTAEGFDVVYEHDEAGQNKTVKLVKVGGGGKERPGEKPPKSKGQATTGKGAPSKDVTQGTKGKGPRPPGEEQEAAEKGARESLAPAPSAGEEEAGSPPVGTPAMGTAAADQPDAPHAADARGDASPPPLSPRLAPSTDDASVSAALTAARQQHLLDDDATGDGDGTEADAALPGWSAVPLHPRLKRALAALQFATPTPVQATTLPPSLGIDGQPRDVVGIAQTGSGKTLAYGLPILAHVLSEADKGAVRNDRPLEALVLTPTRELALQVTSHLDAVSVAGGHFANVATVCGGMSVQKQQRVLAQRGGAHVVVATPGRLWDVLTHDNAFAARVRQTRFLVIDEADRMVEAGHFAEMDAILRMVRRTEGAAVAANAAMQTFVYSATMSRELQTNLKRVHRKRLRDADGNTLDDLLSRVDFRDADPVVVELMPQRLVADTLQEAKIECLAQDKDAYLYYLLLRYPGRTLVFVNSIDSVRRLQPLLTQLGVHAYPLHGQLQQQQRLRNLDRFRRGVSRPDAGTTRAAATVLLATDVAARGIDVECVDHVVHFQLPRSADTYVHRSGRTARAGHAGVAVSLIEPGEQRLWRDIWKSLGRDDRVPPLPVEYTFLEPIRERVALAKQIDALVHRDAKSAHDDGWLRTLAKEAEVDLDSDGSDRDADAASSTRKRNRGASTQIAQLKGQLAALLARPLSARGISQKYITSGTQRDWAASLLSGSHSANMLGVKRSSAHKDVAVGRKRAKGGKAG
ncbi:RNA helicase [Malassezia sp. CBS 17886]|nr:RNA helicase [Malassezia sp. CBS 17886]